MLNLLPVPGLDGYGVIRPFLPDGVRARMIKIERVGVLLLFALIFFVPGVSDLIFKSALTVTDLLGVPRTRRLATAGGPSTSGGLDLRGLIASPSSKRSR